jgi:LSU ribosomal protein L10AE
MGNRALLEEAEVKGELVALEAGNVRHNALEAARVMVNKSLASKLGEANFYFRVRVYPHHVLRENKMMAFAGADRLQDGMRLAFGKPVGSAARVYPGTVILEVWARSGAEDIVKEALNKGASKLPIPCKVEIRMLK